MIVMEMIERYAKAYNSNSLVGSYYAKDMLDEISISFVPMVNPDGVTLQQRGLEAFHNKKTNYARDYRLANQFSKTTGYRLIKPETNPTGKGYKDWFIQQFGLPGFTPELSYSVGERHVPVSVFPESGTETRRLGYSCWRKATI
jgi:hypothetical protein